jgi:hypothetical protein
LEACFARLISLSTRRVIRQPTQITWLKHLYESIVPRQIQLAVYCCNLQGKVMPLVTAPSNTLVEGHRSLQHETIDAHPVFVMQSSVSQVVVQAHTVFIRTLPTPCRLLVIVGEIRLPLLNAFMASMRLCA